MKKLLLSALVMGGVISANAQGSWVADSVVVGNQYKNRVYYSLADGAVGSTFEHFDKVDFLAYASAYSTTLRINGGWANTVLYHYAAGDTADWATLDTAGLSAGNGWARVLDDDKDLLGISAFEAAAVGMGGWGEYNSTTHIVEGSQLFVYRKGNVWKKVWIVNKVSGTFNIKLANLDHSGEVSVAIPTIASGKNFVYYSISEDSTYNVEPNRDSYDLVFTKFEGLSDGGQGGPPQVSAVSGVINNFITGAAAPGQPVPVTYVAAQRVSGTYADDAVYNENALSEDFNSIGDKWKGLNFTTFQYYAYDSNSYFILTLDGSIWQLAFTKFYSGTGSNEGKYVFKKRLISAVSIEENNETIGAWNVFPNPTTDYVSVVFNSNVADMANFSLVDLNGRQVMTQNFSANLGINQYTVDIAGRNLPTGIYVATLRAGNVVKTTKLIIQ